jgi:amino acid permease
MTTTQHAVESLTQSNHRIPIVKIFSWLSITLVLLFMGLLVVMGPKWPEGFIHIHISSGHGFTDQDAFALIPIFLGIAWFGIGVWKSRYFLRDYIRSAPEKAVIFALIFGLLLGLTMGVGFGAIFKSTFKALIQYLV